MADDMLWEDPPEMAAQRGRVTDFVEALKKRPGKWARDPVTFTAAAIGTVRKKQYPGTEWTTRKLPDGSYAVWGRWVGG